MRKRAAAFQAAKKIEEVKTILKGEKRKRRFT
jgi:hypothetical protein